MKDHKNTLIAALIGRADQNTGDFLISPDGRPQTHADFAGAVWGVARTLIGRGIAPGDRLLAQVAKSPDALVLYLATIAAGGIFVPINPAYTPSEVEYFLKDAEPAIFVCDATTLRAASVAQSLGIAHLRLDSGDLAPTSGEFLPLPRAGDDIAAILYTSGTTGRSKGAMLTHDNLLSNAMTLTEVWKFTARDCLLHALPIFHTHGLFVATNVALVAGASMIFLPKFEIDAVLRHLPRATTMMGVPTFYTRMLADPRVDRAAMQHMRLLISGSAPLLAETHRAFAAKTGHAILERYGMTETNMIASNPLDGDRRAGTVGQPLPGTALRIAAPDEKGIGGIEVQGPNVTPGYWRNAEKTAETFSPDGWFITGDLGTWDSDGYLMIVGRQKDLIISGGYNIYPKEIEDLIDAVPGVVESAAYGIADPDLGEAVAAAVVISGAPDDVRRAIGAALDADLARYKHPRQIRFIETLPRNAMGKVQKALLKTTDRPPSDS